MSNIFYGTPLLDDAQVEKSLKTSEGVERVASLVLSMKAKGLLPYIDKYASEYNVPREYVFGIILDEQFRSHVGYEINSGDMGDTILSFFDVAGTSTGMAQTEPLLVAKCFLNYAYNPSSAGGKSLKSKYIQEMRRLVADLESEDYGDTGLDEDDIDLEDITDSAIEEARDIVAVDDFSSEFFEAINLKLVSDNEFVIETVTFLLDYYRNKWRSIEGLKNLDNWHDSIDEWDVIAYTYSRGLEDLKAKGSFGSPEERTAKNLPERPSGSSRGKGIGDIGREALKVLDGLDGDKDLQESIQISESSIRKIIRKSLLNWVNN
jgi:hypothetical protein